MLSDREVQVDSQMILKSIADSILNIRVAIVSTTFMAEMNSKGHTMNT